jgi:hypothetical protein
MRTYRPYAPTEVRFRAKFAEGASDACWIWQSNTNGAGYGLIWDLERKRKVLAHRYAYELHYGVTLPKGQSIVIAHHCDNPACVNPAHLFATTIRGNAEDMVRKGRSRTVRTENSTNPPRFVGSECWNSKLTEKLVTRYRKELAAGKALRQLARETGIARRTLMHMRDRTSWKHVP